ncbi:hypothetical protein F52700_5790 [Fusarium sp. NRRL 52700]|nr:hypothetical protein F52700_5790 [Fusarium sp. NRRL 52700]
MANKNESSKNAAASQEGIPTFVEQDQATPDTIPSPCPVPSLETITRVMQNHRQMVYHQLKAKCITPEDQERFVSDFFVFEPNASERAAVERIGNYFGVAPANIPRRLFHGSPQADDDYIRAVIRNGLLYGYIPDHDIRGLIAEQIVPLGEAGLASSPAFLNIAQCLIKFAIPLRVNSVDADGNMVRYIARMKPEGYVGFDKLDDTYEITEREVEAEVGESHQPQTSNSEGTSESQAQKNVERVSPVGGEPSREPVDEGDGHVSPVGFEPSGETIEDDDHGSNASETLQLDDLGDQDTEPTFCGSETRSDSIVKRDLDAHDHVVLALCKAVEHSILGPKRAQKKLNQTLLRMEQCKKRMADRESSEKQTGVMKGRSE